MSAPKPLRYVVYRCPGCRKHITRSIGAGGEFKRAAKTQQSFCATKGKPMTIVRVREVTP